ncbi:peptidase C14 caspase catalytic subunit p20 [Labilithrix luteola]|uniref:Peptidase C14 caspase catalytic subunit p20 n=1 Tax=Labilithrix luteola TaxID=1391654 RepID=A0A0K1PV84_9BACT|nr:peptidase C14 caspase catalytic subunit p20 [Labilithrix luteola]
MPHPHAYGILIGNNAGGAGQQPLRYAEDDARRMAEVLRQLGRYGTSDLQVLTKPTSAAILSAVDDVTRKMQEHARKGEQAVLVFYYSGHAKANSFSLGGDELAIAQLRDKLRQIPTTLTLVILDACQSGQFARVKGAEPAADFSFNSVSRLTTKGIAVMASSSGQELSQESDELKGSYFTHHLITALRGAADADSDGRVSLDEAYRYAYRRTLSSTSQTQVGTQHVTLDIDLAGQGDVPVTYPAEARSQLELPAAMDGKVLVLQKPSGNVAAEVQKAPGAPLRLAFAAGAYEATIRANGKVLRCNLALADDRVVAVDLGLCDDVKRSGVAKGDGEGETEGVESPASQPPDVPATTRPAAKTPWSAEITVGYAGLTTDAYNARLEEFGYRGKSWLPGTFRISAAASRAFTENVSLGVRLNTLGADTYERNVSGNVDKFDWAGYGAMAFARASVVVVGRAHSWTLSLYGQGGAGIAMARTTLSTSARSAPSERHDETEFGLLLGATGGFEVRKSAFAMFAQAGYDYAPAMRSLTGETHSVGGWFLEPFGARFYF